MAQFDVFKNPATTGSTVPFVVCLQNTRYDRLGTRLVAPLSLPLHRRVDVPWTAPSFIVAGHLVVLDVFGLATLPASRLGQPVWSLADEDSRHKIVHALDELLSQA